jgi:hypothetical protein
MILALLLQRTCADQLVFVQELFRHGARYPIYNAPDNLDIRQDFGELTPVGMRQHFILGQALRKRYIQTLSFLSPTYNHTQIYIRSSDVNRTLMSAQSQLLGLYYEQGPTLEPSLRNISVPPFQGVEPLLEEEYAIPGMIQPVWIETVLGGATKGYAGDFLRQYS